jgi:hypothetical protein
MPISSKESRVLIAIKIVKIGCAKSRIDPKS